REVDASVKGQQVDHRTVRTISDSLGEVAAGLDGLSQALDPAPAGQLGTGLGTAADYLDEKVAPSAARAAEGLEKATAGLRKAAKGVEAAVKEWDSLNEGLPKLNEALEESRKAALATREALGTALKQQEKVEPLLKDVPEHAARLAEELPRLGEELAKVL